MNPLSILDGSSGDLVKLLQKLVQIPTVNPPGADYDKITAVLVEELTALDFKTERLSIPVSLLKKRLPLQTDYPRYNVLGRWETGANKTVHFNAHYDVVPVSGKWRHGSPFSGKVSEGWIYGRGTGDMKGSIASLLTALKAMRRAGVQPKCNVEISFTADEETDSALGAEWVVKNAKLKADYAVVMEGADGPEICCGHNGVVWLRVSVWGQAAHGSTPTKGINALEKMSSLVLELQKYKKTLSLRKWKAPNGDIMSPTLNIGGVFEPGEGGKINTVPAFAAFTLDRRVLPTEDHQKAEEELRSFLISAAKRTPQCKISLEKISENFSCLTNPDQPFQRAFSASLARVKKVKPKFRVSRGFNDMHFFAQHLKVPTVGYGPLEENCHAVDERAPVADLVATAKVYADFLLNFTGE